MLQHLCTRHHIRCYPHIAAYHGATPDGDTSQYSAVAVYDDVILEYRMAVNALDGIPLHVKREASGTKGHPLIELYMIPDDARGANHHACAMVYRKVVTYSGGRVYVDASLAMSHLRDYTRYERYTQQMQSMSYTVAADSAYGWIAADDLAIACGCRVAIIRSHHIGRHPAA